MNDVAGTTAPVQPNQAFDLQKKQIREEEARRQKEQANAMQRRLSTSGFQQGSGQSELQQRRLQQELGQQQAQRLGAVDIEQAQQAEAARQAELGRGLTREQMAQQESQFQAGTLGLTREQMAQEAAQFGQTIEQQKYLQSQQLGQEAQQFAGQQELAYTQLQSQQQQEQAQRELQIKLENMRGDQQYLQIQAASGTAAAERNMAERLANKQIQESQQERLQKYGAEAAQLNQQADQFARQLGFNEAEAATAAQQFTEDLLWQKDQLYSTQSFAREMAQSDQTFQKELATLQDTFASGQITLESVTKMGEEAQRLVWDSIYRRGQNGEILDTSTMSPTEATAYQAGLAGARKDEFDRRMQQQLDLRNNMIINASEPEVVARVQQVYAQFGITPWYPGQEQQFAAEQAAAGSTVDWANMIAGWQATQRNKPAQTNPFARNTIVTPGTPTPVNPNTTGSFGGANYVTGPDGEVTFV